MASHGVRPLIPSMTSVSATRPRRGRRTRSRPTVTGTRARPLQPPAIVTGAFFNWAMALPAPRPCCRLPSPGCGRRASRPISAPFGLSRSGIWSHPGHHRLSADSRLAVAMHARRSAQFDEPTALPPVSSESQHHDVFVCSRVHSGRRSSSPPAQSGCPRPSCRPGGRAVLCRARLGPDAAHPPSGSRDHWHTRGRAFVAGAGFGRCDPRRGDPPDRAHASRTAVVTGSRGGGCGHQW